MKVLYVEDELSENIPRITRLFAKYLGEERIKKLEMLEKDESGYGATPEEIKRIVEETELIEVEYRFPDALRKIIDCYNKYALFIIDRNLNESEYTFEEVQDVDSDYDEEQNNKYSQRTGDYLLLKLALYYHVDVMKKFYFLTAYPAQDELRSEPKIAPLIDFKQFKVENFIEKGNNRDLKRLQDEINNNKILNLQSENIQYLNILRTYIDDQTSERFLSILDEKDNLTKIIKNSKEMRDIYEKILRACAKRIPKMKESCMDNYRRTIMGLPMIDWLSVKGYINSIRRELFFTISKITDVLYHSTPKNPSTDTINALVYALKDMILWFDGICQKYPNPKK